MDIEDRYQPLLVRRIRRDQIVVGRAYVIHARNGGVGVAVDDGGRLGYRLHRTGVTDSKAKGPAPILLFDEGQVLHPRRRGR